MWSYNYTSQNELYHHGIKGQKWGVRRYQNSDGTWTPEGKIRYGSGGELSKKDAKQFYKNMKTISNKKASGRSIRASREKLSKMEVYKKAVDELTSYSQKERDTEMALLKMEEDYYSNDELYTKYQTMAAKQEYKEDPSREMSLDDFVDMYVNEDFDQQGRGFDLYLNSNKDIKRKYYSAQRAYIDASETLREKREEIGRDLLGDQYDKPLYKTPNGDVMNLGQRFMYEILAETEKRWH